MIEGPLGGAAFNNEFGRPPSTAISAPSSRKKCPPPGPATATELRGYHKPIMLAGGLGNIKARARQEGRDQPRRPLIVLGGPACSSVSAAAPPPRWRAAPARKTSISPASSATTPKWSAAARRSSTAAGPWATKTRSPSSTMSAPAACPTPCPSSSTTAAVAASSTCASPPNDEPGMSPLEIWCNESQERYVLAVPAEPHRDHFSRALRTRALPLRHRRRGHRGKAARRRGPAFPEHAPSTCRSRCSSASRRACTARSSRSAAPARSRSISAHV
jgi:phosphoribosylformylglycinamidine synthase